MFLLFIWLIIFGVEGFNLDIFLKFKFWFEFVLLKILCLLDRFREFLLVKLKVGYDKCFDNELNFWVFLGFLLVFLVFWICLVMRFLVKLMFLSFWVCGCFFIISEDDFIEMFFFIIKFFLLVVIFFWDCKKKFVDCERGVFLD